MKYVGGADTTSEGKFHNRSVVGVHPPRLTFLHSFCVLIISVVVPQKFLQPIRVQGAMYCALKWFGCEPLSQCINIIRDRFAGGDDQKIALLSLPRFDVREYR